MLVDADLLKILGNHTSVFLRSRSEVFIEGVCLIIGKILSLARDNLRTVPMMLNHLLSLLMVFYFELHSFNVLLCPYLVSATSEVLE